MSRSIILMLASAASFGVMANDSYEEVVQGIIEKQRFQEVKQTDLNQGSGKNAFTDTAARATTADKATTVATAEKNAIIAAARNGNAKSASYASKAGTASVANKLATSERNSIINTARSGMGGVSVGTVCNALPTFTTYKDNSNVYEHNFVWSGGKCIIQKKSKYVGCGTCGGKK